MRDIKSIAYDFKARTSVERVELLALLERELNAPPDNYLLNEEEFQRLTKLLKSQALLTQNR